MEDDNPLRTYADLSYQDNPEVQRSILIEAAIARGLPPNFLLNLAKLESAGEANPRTAVGRRELPGGGRARGILQFIPKTAKAYGIDPFDVKQSADAAASMASTNLQRLRKNFPKLPESDLLHLAGVAHHSGAENILRARGVPKFPFAQDYSKKLKSLTGEDASTLREAINFPIPQEEKEPPLPPPPRPASTKPAGAAAQPKVERRSEGRSLDEIQSMFSAIGRFLPDIKIFGGPVV